MAPLDTALSGVIETHVPKAPLRNFVDLIWRYDGLVQPHALEDSDAHCEQARAAGAEIIRGPESTDYGSREYTARDLEGHLWSFGTYRPSAAH